MITLPCILGRETVCKITVSEGKIEIQIKGKRQTKGCQWPKHIYTEVQCNTVKLILAPFSALFFLSVQDGGSKESLMNEMHQEGRGDPPFRNPSKWN